MKKNSYRQSARLLRALSHPVRLELLGLLSAEEECVCHLTAVTGRRQAYVSQQLAALRRTGLVEMRKEGLRVYYRVNDPHASAILKSLGIARAEHRVTRGCQCPKCVGEGVAHSACAPTSRGTKIM